MTSGRGPLLVLAAVALLGACSSDATADGPTSAELRAQGGTATVSVAGAGAFARPVPGLDSDNSRTFALGNSLFTHRWVAAPSSTGERDGLGPLFNAPSCSSCHSEAGRGAPPVDADDPQPGLLLRLSVLDADGQPQPERTYGDQLQDRAVPGVPAEGTVIITTTERPGRYPDGTPYSLGEPHYEILDATGQPLGDEVLISARIAPAVFGVGLLEAVPAADVIANADPDDADGDGISGRAHLIPDGEGGEALGRFGWKAAVPTVQAQTAGAFVADLGITSSLHRQQSCTRLQPECLSAPNGGDPEISDRQLAQVTFYTRTLAVPARRGVGRADTAAGQATFEKIGCASCHLSELRTGSSDIAALADQTIRPYTDLLLHDMGDDLADDRADLDASGTEWRTAPLWGIGLTETVNGHTRFLHDGRARSLEEAILWHGGEAAAARARFTELVADERRQLLAFLESL